MAISNVSICNRALSYIGAKSITSLTDDSENARKCNAIFEQERDDLMSAHRWHFAINRATLAALSDAPAYDYAYAYQLPTDPYCLRVLEMKEERDDGEDWMIEGRTLVTDASSCRVKYLGLESDPSKYSHSFITALVIRLAAILAISVTNSRALSEHWWTLYSDSINEAYQKNAIEGHADEDDKPIENEGSWLSERG